MRSTQIPLFTPETEWVMPEELKDLRGAKEIAIDLETNDPHLKELGSGNVTGKGHIAGIAVAVEGWSGYFPIGHESNGNMDKKLVFSWLQDMFKGVNYDSLEKQVGGKHYKDMKIQPAEFINENKLLFAEGNAIKYICRHSIKGKEEDVKKAIHYLEMILERDYS